ncbi:MAG: glycoside hydrolase family 43 protein [Spirochaetaceae bacterium]
MTTVKNPVLSGFHPDPSICRVGAEYYIATSTFEWFPGVMIYSSIDLLRWELRATPLDRPDMLDMRGNPPSGGVWAPCLSHDGERFHLIYTDVKGWVGSADGSNAGFKDSHNYLVTAPSVEGPWSERTYLNSSGFDPSLFHDDDGSKWLLNMQWDYRVGKNHFSGIVVQEFDPETGRLTGPITNIFRGTSVALTEAPHLYKRNGWYYLMTAEGGTSYGHAVTLARSRRITGPYELHPRTPLLTSVTDRRGFDDALSSGKDVRSFLYDGLQKAGHGSMAPVTDDEWVLAHLCGRPLPGTLRCPLGRETALQKLMWRDDDWPWPESVHPATSVSFSVAVPVPVTDGEAAGALPAEGSVGAAEWVEEFDAPQWAPELQSLRVPLGERFDLTSRPGWIALRGAESPTSRFRQTLLARRVQAFRWSAQTKVDFDPEDFQQFAGLSVRYDEGTQLLLRISRDDEGRRTLGILAYERHVLSMPLGEREPLISEGVIELGVVADERAIRFRWRPEGGAWSRIGPDFDPSKLSDDWVVPLGFTGTFVGIGSFDLSGRGRPAYFDYLRYSETE